VRQQVPAAGGTGQSNRPATRAPRAAGTVAASAAAMQQPQHAQPTATATAATAAAAAATTAATTAGAACTAAATACAFAAGSRTRARKRAPAPRAAAQAPEQAQRQEQGQGRAAEKGKGPGEEPRQRGRGRSPGQQIVALKGHQGDSMVLSSKRPNCGGAVASGSRDSLRRALQRFHDRAGPALATRLRWFCLAAHGVRARRSIFRRVLVRAIDPGRV